MMMDKFTQAELIPYIGIVILAVYILISNYRKGYQTLFSPITFVVAIFSYYCVIGPYENVQTGHTYDRLLNMRPFYTSAFWGAFISLSSIFLGYSLNRKMPFLRSVPVSPELLGYYGKYLFIIGFILFTISTNGNVLKLINPLDAEAVESTGGGFSNYLNLCLNFLIPAVTLLFAYFLWSKKGFGWFILTLLLSIGLFVTLGFRYRILLIVVSLFFTFYLTKRSKPNPVLFGAGAIAFITLMGIINLTRNYGSGLSLNRLQGGTTDYYESGLVETRIFQTSGAVIDLVPDKHPYAGFTPIVSTLLFPIPRAIYKDKDSGEYLFNVLDAIYGKKISKGAAFMMYAEYYLAFGWLGLIIGSFLIGWFYKKIWLWYLVHARNPLVIVVYSVTVSYLYVIISRGYLPQVTMLFFFSVFPVYIILWFVKRSQAHGKRKPRIVHAN